MDTEKEERLRAELEHETGTMRRQELLRQLWKLERQRPATGKITGASCGVKRPSRVKTDS